MKKVQLLYIILLLFIPSVLSAACETACTKSGTTYTCTDASYDCVSAAAADSTIGDTINITATGSVTWETKLALTKGIRLIGPGQANLTITSTVSSTDYAISYIPAAPTANGLDPFEISGFTWITNHWLYGAVAYNKPQTQIKIHHNTVANAYNRMIFMEGPLYGVIYNNTFGTGESESKNTPGATDAIEISAAGTDTCNDWSESAPPFSHGSALNMYAEDNQFNIVDTPFDGGHGGRVVVRYNTYNYHLSGGTLSPWFDIHGNQESGVVGPRGAEWYGNDVNTSPKAFDIRGGEVLAFMNRTNGSTTAYVREEYDDAITCSGLYEFRPKNTYIWGNRRNDNILFNVADANVVVVEGLSYTVAENQNFWQERSTGTFNGTGDSASGGGVGCGTLANRPTTCTTGVGYWATNQKCDDLTGMVGANPSTPISGTLYKCTSTDTWEPYYTPYTYPHPLRGLGNRLSGGVVAGGTF